MSISRKRKKADKLSDEVREKAKKVPVETLALMAGVSKQTVSNFREGGNCRLETAEKISKALAELKRDARGRVSLTIKHLPEGRYALESGPSFGGTTTVKAITQGKRCGWCGEYHGERLECK
jgi:DNA-binding XRE family transcriptional regulator